MSIKGHGTGRAGKLRIRTKDKRWIEVPYGAGQDTNMRSVNVWDGEKWMCPTWGRLLFQDWYNTAGEFVDDLPTLQFKKPVGFTGWTGYKDKTAPNEHWHNPNFKFHLAGSDQWTVAEAANFERLFYLTERSPETYRLVPLYYPFLPNRAPNVTLEWENEQGYYDGYFGSFWPNISTYEESYYDSIRSDYDSPGIHARTDMLARTVYAHTEGPVYTSTFADRIKYDQDRRTYNVGLIDLKAIRERLEAQFAQQKIDWTGQKHDQKDQDLKRVLCWFNITPNVWYWGKDTITGLEDFDGITLNLRYAGNVSTIPLAGSVPYNGGQDLYTGTLNHPGSTDPAGVPCWSMNVGQLNLREQIASRVQAGTGTDGLPLYWNQYHIGYQAGPAVPGIDLYHTFEAPPVDNICFYAEVVNPVPWHDIYSDLVINFTVTVGRILLQYADHGTDVPDVLKTYYLSKPY